MKTNFTEGEWYLSKDLDKEGIWQIDMVRGEEGYNLSKHHAVMDIVVRMEDAESNEEELEANAYLIKTAPKMYKMLELMSTMLPNVTTNRDEFYLPEIKRDVDKLLAAARGGDI